ncbi:uncharacterized protein [Prorops nasuta]|uniref:uncharacterized protein n=1 Tax=Prorops nasuta TaxID=863751 RepID=UPI0034CF71F4
MENSICNDLIYKLKQLSKEQELSSEAKSKLGRLYVKLEETVLPQHKIETYAGTHPPTSQMKKEFEKFVLIKKGLFSPEEDDIIVHNWKKFCTLHEWDPEIVQPFLIFRKGTTSLYIRSLRQRRRFVQFLAQGLPNRTLYSVYYRFRNLYSNHLQTRYKPEDDAAILAYIENNTNINEKRKFSDLAKILNRTRASVWRRYRLLKSKKTRD